MPIIDLPHSTCGVTTKVDQELYKIISENLSSFDYTVLVKELTILQCNFKQLTFSPTNASDLFCMSHGPARLGLYTNNYDYYYYYLKNKTKQR